MALDKEFEFVPALPGLKVSFSTNGGGPVGMILAIDEFPRSAILGGRSEVVIVLLQAHIEV